MHKKRRSRQMPCSSLNSSTPRSVPAFGSCHASSALPACFSATTTQMFACFLPETKHYPLRIQALQFDLPSLRKIATASFARSTERPQTLRRATFFFWASMVRANNACKRRMCCEEAAEGKAQQVGGVDRASNGAVCWRSLVCDMVSLGKA